MARSSPGRGLGLPEHDTQGEAQSDGSCKCDPSDLKPSPPFFVRAQDPVYRIATGLKSGGLTVWDLMTGTVLIDDLRDSE
jgi:hypothetical protein